MSIALPATRLMPTFTANQARTLVDTFPISIDAYGAAGDGVTNVTDIFRAAISESLDIFIPQGTYLIEPTADSGDFMLYLGVANGNASRDGMYIHGTGPESIIKLGDNVGRGKLLFGSASGDEIRNMTFRDLTIDLNGQNNLQTSYADPLRLNSAFYLFSYCENILFENVRIINGSGSQLVRIGNDTALGVGKNIQFVNCTVENFGIAISGNLSQDTSAIYIEAEDVQITGCRFVNEDFTFDLSKGHTAIELHGKRNTKLIGNTFNYVQLPFLLASLHTDAVDTVLADNVFYQTNYLMSFDGESTGHAQSRVLITNNIYESTKASSVIIPIGPASEGARQREQIVFTGNIMNGTGNTHQRTHIFKIENTYLDSLLIENNDIQSFKGDLVYLAGIALPDGVGSVSIINNRLDSLGADDGGTFPGAPSFALIAPTTNTLHSLVIEGNHLYNTQAKDYSLDALWRRTGSISYLRIANNTVHFASYTTVIGAVVVTQRQEEFFGETTWDPGNTADGAIASTTVSVPGAVVGDCAIVGFNPAVPAGAILSGAVTVAGTVTVTLFNKTGAPLDLLSGTLRVWTRSVS